MNQSYIRGVPSNGSSSSASAASSSMYTEEQITIVKQIKKKKDFYDILGLEKTCTVDAVTKAYRRLSLKVHPDKNRAPGAEEAFKAVSEAFQCLSNDESRKKYELTVTGSDEPVYGQRATRRHGGYDKYYDDYSPDEILMQHFRYYYFGGPPPARSFWEIWQSPEDFEEAETNIG